MYIQVHTTDRRDRIMQTMQTAADILKALRPRIEAAVMRHATEPYGADAIIVAHYVRWSGDLAQDPSGNHLRSEAARRFLQDLGWTSLGWPHDDHIRALHVACYGLEYAMLVSGASWVPEDVAAALEPFRQS